MPGKVKLISVTHKTISLRDVKHFVLEAPDQKALADRLHEMKAHFGFQELFYLATCNRVLFLYINDEEHHADFLPHFFDFVAPNLPDYLAENLHQSVLHFNGREALNHLLEVASSIDSLVIGEREILRQIREAYNQCYSFGITGDYIRIIINQAIVSAKAVYSKTKIGEKPVSVVSLAIRQLLATKLPKTARILVVGAGQTNRLVAKFLSKYQFENIVVFNRSLERAQQLIEVSGGEALPLTELEHYRAGFDCMIVCTGATEPIITEALYAKLIGSDTERKVLIDLAIPHNIAPGVVQHNDVKYIEIEGLKSLASDNLAFREKEVIHAKQLLKEELNLYPTLFQQRRLEIALKGVPQKVKAVKQKALEEVFHKEIAHLDDSAKDLMERMLTYMEKKCISIPMKEAREAFVSV